jgi:hypothetical protein
MHTKILIRPLNFHLRYQHWASKQKTKEINELHISYACHVFEQMKTDIKYESNAHYVKLLWMPKFKDSERLAYIIEHFKNTLLKNKYKILKYEERNEIWDKGINVFVKSINLISDSSLHTEVDPNEVNFGNIYLEQNLIENEQSLCITAKNLENKPKYSFEKLMELLLKS